MEDNSGKRLALAERGATAIEFALVFPLLFALLYGVVVYAYLFVMQESITYAAQQGASAAVNVSPVAFGGDVAGYRASVEQSIRCNAARTLRWLPQAQRPAAAGCDGLEDGDGGVQILVPAPEGPPTVYNVELRFAPASVFPQVSLPFFGEFPPLPQAVVATASVLLGESP